MTVPIVAILLIVVGIYFLSRYLRKEDDPIRANSATAVATQVNDRFIQLISDQEPDLYKKIDGKFMIVQNATGQIIPYVCGQDLTDDEFNRAMEVFKKAYQEVLNSQLL